MSGAEELVNESAAAVPVPLRAIGDAEAASDDNPETTDRIPLPLIAYITLVVLGGAAVIIAGAPTLSAREVEGLIALGIIIMLAQNFELSIYGDSRVSMSIVPTFAVALLYGPGAAAITYPAASAAADIMRPQGKPWYRNLFNYGVFAVVGGAIGWIDRAVMGDELTTGPEGFLATIAAAFAAFAVNTGLVAIAVSLNTGRSLRSVYDDNFLWALPHYLVLGLIGAALGLAYHALGLAGILAFLAPPVMMHVVVRQYILKTARTVEELRSRNTDLEKANSDILRMAECLQETYEGTLEALVSALDARDRETKGHSFRVMQYTMDMARILGVAEGSPEWVDIQRGALLHDIGKIGVTDSILHKPGPLTPEEWVEMKKHPRIGQEMLRDIPFLAGAAAMIMAHHERFDGKGYPEGLAGEGIPLGARIFVVADTFDAMTSHRPYRRALPPEVSREEIIKNSGTQFDPRVVQAFLQVYPDWAREKAAEAEHEESQQAA